MSGVPPSYRVLDADGVIEMLAALPVARRLLASRPESWTVREVGDGNLNLVFIVDGGGGGGGSGGGGGDGGGGRGSLCVKQAVPYVRAAGPSWPMALERIFFEQSYYREVSPFVGSAVPMLHHYDSDLCCIVMERLEPHIILRRGLIAGKIYSSLASDVGRFIARACFYTSDLARPFERKFDGAKLFARNQALLRISVDLIFIDPYIDNPRNRHTSPQLDSLAARLRQDAKLKAAVSRWGVKFLTLNQALLHGDLHSGSLMVTETDTRVIDPEFAFYGPIGFDLGAFIGNLLLAYFSQAGHAGPGDDRVVYRQWLLEQIVMLWTTFRESFLSLWRNNGTGDAFPSRLFTAPLGLAALEIERDAYMDALFADMLGFAACKMIRRILGFAHVLDFESIADPDCRASCEARAITMAHTLLTRPEQFPSIEPVLALARASA